MGFQMSSNHKFSREFQVFAKPVGARCNMRCDYCYYLPYANQECRAMADDLLESYIIQHIQASTDPVIRFSWHGGEPALLGLDRFQKIVSIQKKHCPGNRRIANGIQTNGILLNREWCRFLAEEDFSVGLSLDGVASIHDQFRLDMGAAPTHSRVLEAYECLRELNVATECLCVVHAGTVRRAIETYDFFRSIDVPYLTFLPLVEHSASGRASARSVPSESWGEFLISIFDRWLERDIGRIKIQIFEEALRSAFGLPHTLCILRPTCGGVPALECNGDLYCCDHFRTAVHLLGNILDTDLGNLLDSAQLRDFGSAKQDTLPEFCRQCEVLDMCNGGCPKNRFARTPEGAPGLNYLCSGYKNFFTHCRPFADVLSEVWRNQSQ